MKNKCAIIKDILPLYIEDIVSDETREFVDEHLQECPECKKLADEMEMPATLPEDISAVPLRNLKKQLRTRRIQTTVCAVAVVATILLSLFAYLTAPQYIPFSKEPVSVTRIEDGGLMLMFTEDEALLCSFSEEVTGCSVYSMLPEEGDRTEYRITAWYTIWDRYIVPQDTAFNIYLEVEEDQPTYVYYCQNNGEMDMLIYGECSEPDFGTQALPRLILNHYFFISIAAAIILVILIIIKRKNQKWRTVLLKLVPLPLSYAIATVLITGFPATSYSAQRDLALIVLATVFIYFAAFMGIKAYQSKREADNDYSI